MTKLYLHDALYNTTTWPGSYPDSTTQCPPPGDALPSIPSTTYSKEDLTATHRFMDKNIGTSGTYMAWSSTNTSNTQHNWICKFITPPLAGITQIDLNTWSGSFALYESSLNANVSFMGGVLYVWRPSTDSLVGYINTWGAFHTPNEPSLAATFKLARGSFTSTCQQVTGVLDGDVIIVEIHSRHTQSSATAYTIAFPFDGTNEYVGSANDTTVSGSDFTSYIETPQTLTFVNDFPASIDMDVTNSRLLSNRFITKV